MSKKEILELIQRLPDDVTDSQVLKKLHFRLQVEKGLQDAAAGRVLTQDELKQRIAGWRKSAGR